MRRATTPTITIHIDEQLTDCWYLVTLAQRNGTSITKDQGDCELSEDGMTVLLTLTQEETLSFNASHDLMLQVRYGRDGVAMASNIVTLSVGEVLYEEVVE